MKLVFTPNDMYNTLKPMLYPEEVNVCPVFCVFRDPTLLERCRIIRSGFISCTNTGRLLVAKDMGNRWIKESFMLYTAKKVKINKNIFGQYVIRVNFPGQDKDIKFKFQISPKIIGGSFVYQKQNLNQLVNILSGYVR